MTRCARTMRLGARVIESARPPVVIAELGVNHDGSTDRAIELVEAAAYAGADAIKLQYFRADLLLSRAAQLADYQRAAGEVDPIEMLRRLELDLGSMELLIARAHELGLCAMVTVFSEPLVAGATALAWDALKVASPDIIHRPLIDALARTGLPMILSTGAADAEEVARADRWLADRDDVAFLQCVSSYPVPDAGAALGGIAALRTIVDRPVGLSDHTTSVQTGALAVLLGARILEKHLTWSNAATGPDHAASLEPTDLARYVTLAQRAHRDRAVADELGLDLADPWADRRVGPKTKTVLPIEAEVRLAARQSITATRDLPAGTVLTRDDLTIKRPGVGLEPWQFDEVLGATTARPIVCDTPISSDDLAAIGSAR